MPRVAPLRTRCWPASVLVLGFALAGCGRNDSGAAPGGAPAGPVGAEADLVQVVLVQPGLGARSLLTTFLEPVVDAPVVARHAGIVRSVLVSEGQAVREGDTLALLEEEEQRIAWERADALARQKDAEFDRARQLSERDVLSRTELEAADAEARIARADADQAKLEWDRCRLRAPAAGVVRLVRVRPHDLVEEGQELFRVADRSRLRGSLYLPENLKAMLERGGQFPLRAAGHAASVPARVRILNPVADPVTGLFHVEFEVAGDAGLEPGQEVEAVLGGSDAPADAAGAVLPAESYLERTGARLFAMRVDGDSIRRVPVELGPLGPDGFIVVSGLSAGDLVLAAGETPPPDGAPVRTQVRRTREY